MPLVLNFLIFQFGWFSSVLGGAWNLPWIGPLVVLVAVLLHLGLARRPHQEAVLILSCGILGAIFDSFLVMQDWVTYPSGTVVESLAPYWIVGMWMLFATTLNVSLGWLKHRSAVAAVLGLIAGPLSYVAGARLGGMQFVDQTAALTALAIGWAIMMPLLLLLAERFDGITPREPRAGLAT
jgi:hypothetical protein